MTWDHYVSYCVATVDNFADYEQEHHRVYRGQADADWRLLPTAMRCAIDVPNKQASFFHNTAVREFARLIKQLPDSRIVDKGEKYLSFADAKQAEDERNRIARHFGVPSMLLDFTLSPLIAAYFAFRDAKSGSVAIWEMDGPSNSNSYYHDDPRYGSTMDPTMWCVKFIRPLAHVCAREVRQNCCYIDVVDERGLAWLQNKVLAVFVLDSKEAPQALRFLDACSINEFTLMQTEDAAARTVSQRALRYGKMA